MKVRFGTNLWFYPVPWTFRSEGNITVYWLWHYAQVSW